MSVFLHSHHRYTVFLTVTYFVISSMSMIACESRGSSDSIPTFSFTDFNYDQRSSDPEVLTQCLAWEAPSTFWQTSGDQRVSYLIKHDLQQGHTERWRLDGIFAEGCTRWSHHLLVLTWRSFTLQMYNPLDGSLTKKIPISTEGWGLTASPLGVVYSDGSSTLRWIDTEIFDQAHIDEVIKVIKTKTVYANKLPVFQLNELEWVEEFLFANIYPSDLIAVIAPSSGQVLAWLDLSELRSLHEIQSGVTNGIAYDADHGKVWFTGKQWHNLYGIKIAHLLAEIRALNNHVNQE
jgi:glutaminyl-peptide cyclotransferase